ncbi:MAG: hypothetical protein NVS1B13_15450 [Flavisolibacter sp.]
MKYKDQLVVTGKLNDVGAYTRTNIGNSYRTGIELQGAGQIFKRLKASANLTLSRNKVKNFTEYIDDNDNGGQKMMAYKQSDISFSPAVISAATLSLSIIKNLNLNLINKYVGKQYLDNTSNENRKLSLYATQDFRVNYAILGKKIKQLDLIIQVGNLSRWVISGIKCMSRVDLPTAIIRRDVFQRTTIIVPWQALIICWQ